MRREFGAFKLVVVFAAALVVLQAAAGLFIRGELERRLKIKIEGRYEPSFLQPQFYLRDARFELKKKFRVSAGDLEVRYNPLPLGPSPLHVWLKGVGLKLQLLDSWAEMQGTNKEVLVTRFEAELQLSGKNLMLHSIHLESPAFEFNIQERQGPAIAVPASGEDK